jgi:hypothetical protein
MKAKYFNYVVNSRGRSVKGSLTSKVTIDVERMKQLASWSAQKVACKDGWEFDLMNFIVAVQPIL